jgi:hypothetical protein
MFGIFKKRQPTAMDALIRLMYGDHPPPKSADLERAITIAHDLLCEKVPITEVRCIASGLSAVRFHIRRTTYRCLQHWRSSRTRSFESALRGSR